MHYLYYIAAIAKPGNLPTSDASSDKVQAILQVIFVVLGSVALLMMMIGAFKYVISQGEQTAVRSAKNTVMYSAIGLIVALSAWAIVTYALQGIIG